jgi:hypothetical protein
VLFPIARILRLASVALCLITLASFALFAVDQTSTASVHQQNILNGEVPAPSGAGGAGGAGTGSAVGGGEHKSSLRKVADDASNAVTSPFSGATSGTHSEWTIRTIRLLIALAVYGFGLGFLARMIRVRV